MKNLPKPTVEMPGPGGPKNEAQVRAILANPVYAGIGPYPMMVDDETWVRGAAKAISESGSEQWLVNMLFVLRQTLRK